MVIVSGLLSLSKILIFCAASPFASSFCCWCCCFARHESGLNGRLHSQGCLMCLLCPMQEADAKAGCLGSHFEFSLSRPNQRLLPVPCVKCKQAKCTKTWRHSQQRIAMHFMDQLLLMHDKQSQQTVLT